MSILLLTMGPNLSIMADIPAVGVGSPGVIRFRPIGAAGPVKWTLVDSTLPAEWDSALNPDGNAVTLTTADAGTAGTFSVTVRAVDALRVPVVRTFVVQVLAAANWAWATSGPYPYYAEEAFTASATLIAAEIKSIFIDAGQLAPPEQFTATATLVAAEIRELQISHNTQEQFTASATLVAAEIKSIFIDAGQLAPPEAFTASATLVSAAIDWVWIGHAQSAESLTATATLVSAEITTP